MNINALIYLPLAFIMFQMYDSLEKTKMKLSNLETEDKSNQKRSIIKYAMPVNIETQKVEEYQNIGYLFNSQNRKHILPLFGRRVHSRSSHWNYFTKSSNHSYSIKIPLTYKNRQCDDEYGCEELYDGDEVFLDEYDTLFKVKLYEKTIRYIPYL